MDIRQREEDKPFQTIAAAADYQAELKAAWRWHLAITESSVFCENCNSTANDGIVGIKPHFAKVNTGIQYCDCPGSEVGKIKTDPGAHLLTCKFRRSTKYTSIRVPTGEEVADGYSLGVPTN